MKRKEVTYDNTKIRKKNQHFTLFLEDTGLKKLIDLPLSAFLKLKGFPLSKIPSDLRVYL